MLTSKKFWFFLFLLVVVALAVPLAYQIFEGRFQKDADIKRIYDIHRLAETLEAFKEKEGHYPLADYRMIAQGSGKNQLAGNQRLIVIISPQPFLRLSKQFQFSRPGFAYTVMESEAGNHIAISKPANHAYMSHGLFLKALKLALGPSITLPFDPQKAASGRPNFYQYIVDASGDYILSAALYTPHQQATKVDEQYYKYEIGSKPLKNDAANIRRWKSISDAEKKAVQHAAPPIIARFKRHTKVESD